VLAGLFVVALRCFPECFADGDADRVGLGRAQVVQDRSISHAR
jgi:hypothetical protein